MLTSNITKKGWRFIIQSFGTICLEALFQGKTIKRHACWLPPLPTPNFKHWNVFSRLIQHHGPFWQTSLSPFAQLKKLLMSTTSPSTWRNLENSFPGSWWKCLMVKPSWRLVDPGTYRKSTVEEASGIFWKSGLRYLIWSKLTSTTPGRNFGHPGAFFSGQIWCLDQQWKITGGWTEMSCSEMKSFVQINLRLKDGTNKMKYTPEN